MTKDELDAIVESKLADQLAARLRADRERVRAEVVAELRREAERAWYERINRRAPIQGPGDPQVEAERRAAMDARAKADSEVTVAVSFRRSRAPCLARPQKNMRADRLQNWPPPGTNIALSVHLLHEARPQRNVVVLNENLVAFLSENVGDLTRNGRHRAATA